MKINMHTELENESLIGSIVLEGLTSALRDGEFEEFIDKYKTDKGHIFDVKIFVENKELPLKKVIDLWEKDMDRQILEKAENIVRKRFYKAYDILESMESKIQNELKEK